jgi:hypothetical protein
MYLKEKYKLVYVVLRFVPYTDIEVFTECSIDDAGYYIQHTSSYHRPAV